MQTRPSKPAPSRHNCLSKDLEPVAIKELVNIKLSKAAPPQKGYAAKDLQHAANNAPTSTLDRFSTIIEASIIVKFNLDVTMSYMP